MPKLIPFEKLADADLVVDAVYESGCDHKLGSEPIAKLLPGSGNRKGFRIAGKGPKRKWIVLFTTGEDGDWPDSLDLSTGQFIYFGDNKTPGHELHDTKVGGNKVLRDVFAKLHDDNQSRQGIVPFLVFRKY